MVSIGVIGTGNMGSALIKGWLSLPNTKIYAYDIDPKKLEQVCEKFNCEKAQSLEELISKSTYILLAVKPNQVKDLLKSQRDNFSKEKVIISICAGVKVKKIKKWSGDKPQVVRIMPNTPALVGKGLFAIYFEEHTKDEIRTFVKNLFSNIGEVFEMEEHYFDAYTALIGSGPAYIIYFIEAMVEAGVSLGFSRDVATKMVKGLLSGTTKITEEMNVRLSELREMVTSPAGTTIAALNHLDRCAVRGNIIDAIEKAYIRSKELGKD